MIFLEHSPKFCFIWKCPIGSRGNKLDGCRFQLIFRSYLRKGKSFICSLIVTLEWMNQNCTCTQFWIATLRVAPHSRDCTRCAGSVCSCFTSGGLMLRWEIVVAVIIVVSNCSVNAVCSLQIGFQNVTFLYPWKSINFSAVEIVLIFPRQTKIEHF